jgi:hypothetical protein
MEEEGTTEEGKKKPALVNLDEHLDQVIVGWGPRILAGDAWHLRAEKHEAVIGWGPSILREEAVREQLGSVATAEMTEKAIEPPSLGGDLEKSPRHSFEDVKVEAPVMDGEAALASETEDGAKVEKEIDAPVEKVSIPSQEATVKMMEPILLEKGAMYKKTGRAFLKRAILGEKVETVLDGKLETTNTAKEGDWIVRADTASQERYLLPDAKFQKLYNQTSVSFIDHPDAKELEAEGFQAFVPCGRIAAVQASAKLLAQYFPQGKFAAAWKADMLVEVGDYLCSPAPPDGEGLPESITEVYRIERGAFAITYVQEAPPANLPPAVPFEWDAEQEAATSPAQAVADPIDELDDFQAAKPQSTEQASGSSPKGLGLRLPVGSVASASSVDSAGTPSLFKFLPPPPPPASKVGSPPAGAEVIAIAELVDASAPPPVAATSPSHKAPPIEANLAAVAAQLAVGPPSKLAVGPLKEFLHREGTGNAEQASEDEEVLAGIAVAAAVDADVDDEACETLLGGEQTLAYSGNVDLGKTGVPLGRIAPADGLDSASDEEEAKPLGKSMAQVQAQPAPKRPDSHSTPDSKSAQQPPSPPKLLKVPSPSGINSPAAARAPPVSMEVSMTQVDEHLTRTLDKFFSEERLWQQVAAEVAKSAKLCASMEWLQAIVPQERVQFSVQVPEPYPGIQYRKSKVMGDRYTRYAKHGSVVTGVIEDDGTWLKVTDNVYLPMKVGAVQILKAIEPSSGEIASPFEKPGQRAPTSADNSKQLGATGRETAPSLPQGATDGTTPRSSPDARVQDLDGRPDGKQQAGVGTLYHLDEASRLLSGSEPINPFTDTPRGGSQNNSPLRLLSDPMAPINPFSDTPPGSPRAQPLRNRPLSSAT